MTHLLYKVGLTCVVVFVLLLGIVNVIVAMPIIAALACIGFMIVVTMSIIDSAKRMSE